MLSKTTMGEKPNRKKRAELYEQIVSTLKAERKTILQVANSFTPPINWETTRNAIETLKEIGVLSSEDENGKTYYFVDESNLIKLEKDTLLGLPLTDDQRALTQALFNRFIHFWGKMKIAKRLNKSFLQKMLIELVKRQKIENVPYGWYLFGQCAVLQYDPDLPANSDYPIGTKYDVEIQSVIREYSQLTTTNELMQKHYHKESNELYLTRLKLTGILINELKEENISNLKRELKNFLFSFKKEENNEDLLEYINGFYSITIRIINGLNHKEVDDIRDLINEAFISVWEIMATYNLYKSLIDNHFYEIQVIKKYYSLRIANLKEAAKNYLSQLKDHCPPITVPTDEPLRKRL